MGVNKINDKRILILPRDTRSNPQDTIKIVNELTLEGVRFLLVQFLTRT